MSATPRPRRRVMLLGGLLLMLFGTGLALVVTEVGLRLFWPRMHYGYFPSDPHEPNPFYGTRHQPGSHLRYRRAEFEAESTFNSEGWRSATAYDTGQVIAVLGDSFVAGLEVAEEQTFVKQLEQALRARPLPGLPTRQVQNYGVSGHGLTQAVQIWRQAARHHLPHTAVLVTFPNDVRNGSPLLEETRMLRPRYVENSRGEVQDVLPFEAPAPHTPLEEWGRSTALFRLYQVLDAHGDRVQRGRRDAELYQDPWPADITAAWKYTAWALERFVNETRAAGVRPLVVIMPDRRTVREDAWQALQDAAPPGVKLDRDRWRRAVARELDRLDAPHLDLAEPFRAAREELYFPQDGHLDPAGHALVARLLEARLRELRLPAETTKP